MARSSKAFEVKNTKAYLKNVVEEVLLLQSDNYRNFDTIFEGRKPVADYLRDAKKVKNPSEHQEALAYALTLLQKKQKNASLKSTEIHTMLRLASNVLNTSNFKELPKQKAVYFMHKSLK